MVPAWWEGCARKALMLPTGSWEGGKEWPSSRAPHPQPRANKVPAEKVAGLGGSQACMKASLCPHEMGTHQGLGEGDIGWSKDLRQQRPPDLPAAGLCLSLHSCTSLLLRCLLPRGLLTRDVQKSLQWTLCASEPSRRSEGSLYLCAHSAPASSPAQTWGAGSLEAGH